MKKNILISLKFLSLLFVFAGLLLLKSSVAFAQDADPSVNIQSVSPSSADTQITVSGGATGGESTTDVRCGHAPYILMPITTVTQLSTTVNYSIDGGTVFSAPAATVSVTGQSSNVCSSPTPAVGIQWGYSFSFTDSTHVAALSNGTHTVEACLGTWGSLCDTATFIVSHPLPDLTANPVTPTSAIASIATTFSSTISNIGNASTGGSFSNFFQIATATGGGGTITDLASTSMSTLASGATNTATKSYTFPSSGTYSVRACADKTSSAGGGVINESNENNNCGAWVDVTVNPATCSNGATNPLACTTCAAGSAMIGGMCTPVSVSVSATTPYSTTPSTNVSFAYSANTNSNAGTECRLLNYNQDTNNPLTSYQANSPITYSSASVAGTYAYYVECRDKTTTSATATSNQIIVNVYVNGGWSGWSGWGTCSMSCGGGTQTATRTCTHPAPQNGGQGCSGSDTESQSCNVQACTTSLTANPANLVSGSGISSMLSWSSTAPYCTKSTNFTLPNDNPSGSLAVTPTSTTTYSVTCGGVSATATVSVKKKPIYIEH
ncbi:MAG: CARDB domain-containing protein [Candidatus Pacebacteria bacterium]|nr:CARDB domain-containing protein [Candidatus Paceibacterota bacterium]